MFDGIYMGRRVLVTGHTGFKGSWLAAWLLKLGAEVSGFALEPDTDPALFAELALEAQLEHTVGDVRDAETVSATLERMRPEIVFHLAAQPLVRRSYAQPVYTLQTNVLGTANVLEAARHVNSVRAVVVVTTDKVYRNLEAGCPFSEDDPLGGSDPYSASKACAEIVSQSYSDSFLSDSGIGLSTARAGNVIGGGDWAADRIVPDCVRALAAGTPIVVRNPASLRPWQHVLEPLSGYLWLGRRLLVGGESVAQTFNFGPTPDAVRTVADLASKVVADWGSGSWINPDLGLQPHEASLLSLKITRAGHLLDWHPVWDFDTAVDRTVAWYRSRLLDDQPASTLADEDLEAYMREAAHEGLRWARPS